VSCEECGSYFCLQCINSWLDCSNKKCINRCEFKEKRASPVINRLLSKLKFYCCNNGCVVETFYDDLEHHEKSCEYEKEICQGCKQSFLRKDLLEHTENCELIKKLCEKCQTVMKNLEYSQHKFGLCIEKQVEFLSQENKNKEITINKLETKVLDLEQKLLNLDGNFQNSQNLLNKKRQKSDDNQNNSGEIVINNLEKKVLDLEKKMLSLDGYIKIRQNSDNYQNNTKKIKDKNAPKKPLAAFFFFQKQRRESVKKENPNMDNKQIVSIMSMEWKSMSSSEKTPFNKLHEKDKIRYEKQNKVYEKKKNSSRSANKTKIPLKRNLKTKYSDDKSSDEEGDEDDKDSESDESDESEESEDEDSESEESDGEDSDSESDDKEEGDEDEDDDE
jgi:high mobility group protein B1